MKIEGYRSISPRHGSADPDPHQNVMDPQHWHPLPERDSSRDCKLPRMEVINSKISIAILEEVWIWIKYIFRPLETLYTVLSGYSGRWNSLADNAQYCWSPQKSRVTHLIANPLNTYYLVIFLISLFAFSGLAINGTSRRWAEEENEGIRKSRREIWFNKLAKRKKA